MAQTKAYSCRWRTKTHRRAEVTAASTAILDRYDRVDVLINNAAVIRGAAVNVFGIVNCTQAFAQALATTRGSIINLSSALAKRPLIGTSV